MFDSYIRDHARLSPRAPAVLTPKGRVGYADFDADIDRFGTAVAARGVGSDDGVVSLRISDPYLLCVATAALARLGVASSPSNDQEADLQLDDDPAGGSRPRRMQLDKAWIAAMRAVPHIPLPRLDHHPDKPLRVNLSSGTTRTPRRVGLTAARIAANTHAQVFSSGPARGGLWIVVPGPDSAAGFLRPVSAWTIGACFGAGLPLPLLPELLETQATGILTATPIQLRSLLAALPPGFRPQPGWRVSTGGALCPSEVIREVLARITPDMMISYGSTEASLNTTSVADPNDAPGQVGYPTAGCRIEVLDAGGQPVPVGESGEIRIRSNRMASSYLDDPEASAERFLDGWFHPGDVGRFLPDGRLVIEGRLDDRMNLGGIKFMPQALEGPALECPGVLDAAAFAVPDAAGIDQCWLAVATAPGFDRDTLPVHLARFPGLPPNRFAWIDEIPRNNMGKVERTKLRDALLLATRGDAAGSVG